MFYEHIHNKATNAHTFRFDLKYWVVRITLVHHDRLGMYGKDKWHKLPLCNWHYKTVTY
jgi:hypothetical protein